MAIGNYTQLRDAVLQFSHRDDIDLLIDTFIGLAETEMTQGQNEPLEIRPQETRATASTSTTSRFLALPSGFASMRRIRITVDDAELDIPYVHPSRIVVRANAGVPTQFTVTSQIEFDAISDQEYTVESQYFKDFTPLTEANPTNIVLTQNPNIYLFGVLHQVFLYAVDQPEAAKYQAKFVEAIEGANRKDKQGRYGPRPRMQVRGSTP